MSLRGRTVRAAALGLIFAGALQMALPDSALAAHEAGPDPSAVFQAPELEAATIIRRSLVCVPKFATSGLTTADTIVSNDPASGFLQARNFIASNGFSPNYRSTITVEAKDGRFRIAHTNIEVQAGRAAWARAAYFRNGLDVRLQAQSSEIAECVMLGPVGNDF